MLKFIILLLFTFSMFASALHAEEWVVNPFLLNNKSWPLVSLPKSFRAAEPSGDGEVNMHLVKFSNHDEFEVSISNYGYAADDGTTQSTRDWVLINEIPDNSLIMDRGKFEVFIGPEIKGIKQVIFLQKNPKWGQCFQTLEIKTDFKLKKNIDLTNEIINRVVPTFAR